MITYLISMYFFIALASYLGQINKEFDANILQQVGLGLAGVWCIGRAIMLMTGSAYGYPHEPLSVTFIGVIALGTIQKTAMYCRRKKRAANYLRNKRHIDDDRLTDKLRGYVVEVVLFFKCLISKLKHLIGRAKQRK